MKVTVYENEARIAEAVADTIGALLAEKPNALICLAAGHTSLPAFAELTARERRGEIDLSGAWFVDMDEWVGVSPDTPGACAFFLYDHFLSGVSIPPDHICLFDGREPDPDSACLAVSSFIEERGGIDYMLLGAGMNGHLALNEPGSSLTSRARVVPLSETTKKVAPKYFPDGALPAEAGITLGVADILETKKLQLVITGAHKAGVARRLLSGAATPDFPVSFLTETDAELLLDAGAGRDFA